MIRRGSLAGERCGARHTSFCLGSGCLPPGARRAAVRPTLLPALALVLSILLAPSTLFGGGTAYAKAPKNPLGSLTILRCEFEEGRFVVRYQDRLYVLREGDAVPGTALVVARITPKQAVLTEREKLGELSGPETRGPVVLITKKPGGEWDVTALRGAPAEPPRTVPMAPPVQGANSQPLRTP